MASEYGSKQLKWLHYFLAVVFGTCFVLLVREMFVSGFSFRAAIFLGTICLEWIALFLFTCRLTGTCIRLDNDAVVEECRGRVKRIPYADLREIRFRPFRLREFRKRRNITINLVSDNMKIRVWGSLNNLSEFLLELKRILDAKGLSDRYDEEQLFRSLKGAYTNQRFEKNAGKLLFMACCAGLIGFIVGKTADFSAAAIAICVWLSAVWPFICFLIFLWHRIRKLPINPTFDFCRWDSAEEKAFFRKTLIIGTACYLAAASLLLAVRLTDQNVLWAKESRQARDAYHREKYEKAERKMRKALARAEGFQPVDSRLIDTMVGLTVILGNENKYADAEEIAKRTLAIVEKNPQLEKQNLTDVLLNLGYLYKEQKKYSEAEPYFEKAIANQKGGAAPDTLVDLAEIYVRRDKHSEAETLCEHVIDIYEKGPVEKDSNLAEAYYYMGLIRKSDEQPQEAKQFFQKALVIYEEVYGPESKSVASTLKRLAEVAVAEKNLSDAEDYYERAANIYELRKAPDLEALKGLAAVSHLSAEYQKAESLHKRIIEIEKTRFGSDDSRISWSMVDLAKDYQAQGKYSEAETLLKQVLERERTTDESNQLNQVCFLREMAQLYQEEGKYKEAEDLLVKALDIRKKELGPEHPCVAQSLEDYSAFLRETGRPTEAEKLQAEADSIRALDADSSKDK